LTNLVALYLLSCNNNAIPSSLVYKPARVGWASPTTRLRRCWIKTGERDW